MPDPHSCTCFRLRKLSRLMSQHYDRALASTGINVNQYSILRRLSSQAKAIGALASELGMDRSTLSRDLKPLLEQGWLRQVPSQDARRRQVQTSAAGIDLLQQALPLWAQAQDEVEALLGDSRTVRLHRHLDEAIERLQATP